MSKLIFAFASLLCLLAGSNADVPVLLFGNALPFKVPALKSLASDEFSNLLQSQITEKTVTVVFVEPELKTEDLTCKLDGVTCFENLNGIREKSYLPRVSAPVDGVYDLQQQETEELLADEVVGAAGEGKTIIVNFDAVTSKADYVEHDKIIGDIYRELAKQYKNIVVVYTGRQSGEAKVRRTRAVQSRAVVDWELKKDNNFAIAAEKVTKKVGEGEAVASKITSVKSTLDGNNLNVDINIENGAFTLSFTRRTGNWELVGGKVAKPITKFPRYLFGAEKYSMRCGESLSFHSAEDKTTYTIHNSQFLPVFEGDANLAFDAEKVVHCNGYWTPGILSGLFVVFLLIFILFIGLSFIMDINTMDRFEDPKGKTITISATE